jgi:hypothetical protein
LAANFRDGWVEIPDDAIGQLILSLEVFDAMGQIILNLPKSSMRFERHGFLQVMSRIFAGARNKAF